MRALIQRVRSASVTVDREVTGKIDEGLLVFLGVARVDSPDDLDYLAEKVLHLRVFQDDAGRMNRSVLEAGGAVLLVSQFTLYASTRKGRRPGFDSAARPENAKKLYDRMVTILKESVPVQTGIFGAKMEVELLNSGPVTIMLDSRNRE